MISEKKVDEEKGQTDLRALAEKTFIDLEKFKASGKSGPFNNLLYTLLPDVRSYVKNRLSMALAKGRISGNFFETDDIMDSLYVEIFEHFEEVQQKEDLYPWLFEKAEGLLDDNITEEEFDTFFFQNIDKYTKPEWDEMEEKYTADAEGNPVMLDDLDDSEMHKSDDYMPNHVFVDNDGQNIRDKLDRELDTQNVQKHVDTVLYNLPTPMREVFELHSRYRLNPEEIAQIRGQSVQEVHETIITVQGTLKSSIMSRYTAKRTEKF